MQHRPQSRMRVAPARTAFLRAAVVIGGGLGLVALTAAPASAAPTAVTATITAPATATVGDTLDVAVTVPATADVYGYQVDLTADADVLAVVDGSVTGPEGGFDAVRRTGDTVTLLHTRLGTSPALSGDLTASVDLRATVPGDIDLAVTRVTLVAADGSTTVLTDPASTRVTVAAVPTPTPTATAAPTPGTTPGTDPTSVPGTGNGAGGSGSGTDADSAGTASRTPAGGALAFTGADLAPWLATSAALLALGGGIVLARRRARATVAAGSADSEDAR
jgi:hypothetical protein